MRTRRLTLTALTILTTLGAGLTLASTPAFATKTRLPLPFSPFGSFIDAKGIAVDQSSGNLYVTDINSTKVQVLGSEGGPPVGGVSSTISGASTPQGSFDFNYLGTFVAVDNACYDKKLSGPACASADPSNGDIYLMDSAGQGGRAVVDKFTLNSSGEFEYVCQFIGYTAAGGDECLKNTSGKEVEFEDVRTATVDEDGNDYEFSSTGVPVAAITSSLVPEPNTVAVDSVGNIYIAHQSTGLLVELKRASFTAGTVESEVELANGVVRVALDQATGHLLSIGVGSPLVSEYNQNGELQLQFSLTRSEANKDIAVNEASDFVYVTSENAVEAFGPPVNPVVVTTEGVSNVTAVSATVNGSLDPQGQEAGARFEYGTSPALGSNVVTSPAHVSAPSRSTRSSTARRSSPATR